MKRVKANARWNKLSRQQLKQLDEWLFEEKLPYVEVFRRAKAELGFAGSESSVKRYSLRRQNERALEEFEELRDEMVALNQAPADPKMILEASAKLMGRFLYARLKESPEEVPKWAPVANLLMQNNYTEMLREAKAREHGIRDRVLAFAKEKFEFDTMEVAIKVLPELRELAEARKDPLMKRYEENARLNRLRRLMFGAGQEVQPESAQEEAEMLAMKREREARREQPAELTETITEPAPPGPSNQYYQEYMEARSKADT